MNNTKKRAVAFACALVLSAAATVFCTGCSSVSDLFDIIRCGNKPYLAEDIDCSESAPVLYGCFGSEELNLTLEDCYSDIVETVKQLNSQNKIVHLEHERTQEENEVVFKTYVVGHGGEKELLALFTVEKDNHVSVNYHIPEFMCGGELLCDSYFRLAANGLYTNDFDYDEDLLVQEMCALFVEYYENKVGAEVSTEIFEYTDLDELYMKSAVLGFYEDEYTYTQNDVCYTYSLAMGCRYLLENLYESYCGNSSKVVTNAQAAELCNMFMKLYAPEEDSQVDEFWQDATHLLALSGNSEPATRQSVAEMMVERYEMHFGTMPYDSDYYCDTDDIAMLKAGYKGLMRDFPTYSCMSPECEVWFCELPEIAYVYADILSFYVLDEKDVSAGRIVTKADAICALGLLDRYLDNYPACGEEAVVVDNSGGRDFYFTQYNTGKYSYMNCMPTITAMAVKWYYPNSDVKVSDIRKLYLPEFKEGWYAWQVMDSLSEYNTPYNSYEIMDYSYEGVSEMIIRELDKGNIVLTQMSENVPDGSGHCFVIYGYKKFGDSCVFMVHDPGVYSGFDCFGKHPGEAIEIDSAYACFIINRIAYNIISVGDN